MIKNKTALLGALGIPLAVLGIVGSAAFAANTPAPAAPATTTVTADVSATGAADVETNDDNGGPADSVADTGVETNDGTDAADANEVPDAPGTADANEAPGTN